LKLSYALFEPLQAAKGLEISKDELKKYYEGHQEQFRKPPMANVEYVSLNFPEKATDQQKQETKKQAQDLAKELKADVDFKTIAQKYKAEVKESGPFSRY
jgi:peptidyl-prolyl cis-trans isomerase D